MSDTYTLQFQNFRSLRDVSIDVAPLTVIYGPNGSGKSSVIYGLLTLRNFLTNPNQNVPSLFSYPSISLGGLQEVIHRHQANGSLSLSIGISNPGEFSSTFTLTLEESGGAAKVALNGPVGETRPLLPFELDLPIAIPYSGNQQVGGVDRNRYYSRGYEGRREDVRANRRGHLWNGIILSAGLHSGR